MAQLCRGCGRSLTGYHIIVQGSPYHADCFKCNHCGQAIGNQSYMQKDGLNYHGSCYQEQLGMFCAKCGKGITGKYYIIDGKKLHAECYVCAGCGLPFAGSGYYEKYGQRYHPACYQEQFGPRCVGCGKLIDYSAQRHYTRDGKTYHISCYSVPCAGCGQLISGDQLASSLARNEQIYHASCYHEQFSPRCADCGVPITGRSIAALGKNWHPEHFRCAHCQQSVVAGYYERDGKLYCRSDYDELFGLRCAGGGELIKSRFLMRDEKPYCEQHYQSMFGPISGRIPSG